MGRHRIANSWEDVEDTYSKMTIWRIIDDISDTQSISDICDVSYT